MAVGFVGSIHRHRTLFSFHSFFTLSLSVELKKDAGGVGINFTARERE